MAKNCYTGSFEYVIGYLYYNSDFRKKYDFHNLQIDLKVGATVLRRLKSITNPTTSFLEVDEPKDWNPWKNLATTIYNENSTFLSETQICDGLVIKYFKSIVILFGQIDWEEQTKNITTLNNYLSESKNNNEYIKNYTNSLYYTIQDYYFQEWIDTLLIVADAFSINNTYWKSLAKYLLDNNIIDILNEFVHSLIKYDKKFFYSELIITFYKTLSCIFSYPYTVQPQLNLSDLMELSSQILDNCNTINNEQM